MKFINQTLYNQILETMPIICVDGILSNQNGEILFLKRNMEPAKNQWWFPGGRVIKNEKLSDAIIRKFKEETNISVNVIEYVGLTETIFDTGPNEIPVHTVNFTFLLEQIDSGPVEIDSLHEEYTWSKNIEELNLNKEVYDLLKNKFKND